MEPLRRIHWTAAEYLARERRSTAKHEFFEGEIYARAGATLRPRERCVMHHRRIDAGQWVLTERRDGAVELPALGGLVQVSELYDKVDFGRPDT